MYKLILISKISLLLIFVFSGIVIKAQEKTSIDEWELPRSAREFVAMNFPEQKINQANRIVDKNTKEFEVQLNNLTEIEFDHLGYWSEVNGNSNTIPTEFIPRKIMDYITSKFKSERIIKIEKSAKKYEVKLTQGFEIEFDLKGKFLKMGN